MAIVNRSFAMDGEQADKTKHTTLLERSHHRHSWRKNILP
jgi:hypothetical protein